MNNKARVEQDLGDDSDIGKPKYCLSESAITECGLTREAFSKALSNLTTEQDLELKKVCGDRSKLTIDRFTNVLYSTRKGLTWPRFTQIVDELAILFPKLKGIPLEVVAQKRIGKPTDSQSDSNDEELAERAGNVIGPPPLVEVPLPPAPTSQEQGDIHGMLGAIENALRKSDNDESHSKSAVVEPSVAQQQPEDVASASIGKQSDTGERSPGDDKRIASTDVLEASTFKGEWYRAYAPNRLLTFVALIVREITKQLKLIAGLGVLTILFAFAIFSFLQTSPTLSPLDVEFTILVTPKNTLRSIPIEYVGLPIKAGDVVQFQAESKTPAYYYLFWIDANGHTDPLWPWRDLQWDKHIEQQATQRIIFPDGFNLQPDRSGINTVVLIASSRPVRDVNRLRDYFQSLGYRHTELTTANSQFLALIENGTLVSSSDRSPLNVAHKAHTSSVLSTLLAKLPPPFLPEDIGTSSISFSFDGETSE